MALAAVEARAIDLAGSVMAGLLLVREYLAEVGGPSFDEDTAVQVMVEVIHESWKGTATQDSAELVLDWVWAQLVRRCRGAQERCWRTGKQNQGKNLARACGWVVEGRPPVLGRLSLTGQHVILTKKALDGAAREVPELKPVKHKGLACGGAGEESARLSPQGRARHPEHGHKVRGRVFEADAFDLPV